MLLNTATRLPIVAMLLAASGYAQTQEEREAYPEYTVGLDGLNLTWETVKLKTEDGYTLTAFHITGDIDEGPFEITKPALVLQHGMGGSAEGWLY